MSRRGGIHRYYLILEKVRRGLCPSFAALQAHLEANSFEISPRTLQRDIDALRCEFGVELGYDRERNGYVIANEGPQVEETILFLETATRASVLLDAFEDIHDLRDCVSFDRTGTLRGIEHLSSLLYAVRNRRLVEFDHENYQSEERKHFSVKPHLLKEYEGRWYLWASLDRGIGPLFFGLDRMQNLRVLEEGFTSKAPDRTKLDRVIGISGTDQAAQTVVLEFSALQGKFIQALPLHPTQRILAQDEKRLVVELRVVVNFELIQKILMHGPAVLVLEPLSLAREVEELHEKSAEMYALRHSLT